MRIVKCILGGHLDEPALEREREREREGERERE